MATSAPARARPACAPPGFSSAEKPKRASAGRASYAEVAVPEVAVGVELGGAALPGDAAALDDGVPVGELHQPLDVLVDDEDGLPRGAQPLETLPDFLAQHRRQAFGGFVQYQ